MIHAPRVMRGSAGDVVESAGAPADATTVTDDYAGAQLNALKTSMLTVALLAVLSLWFTRRVPGRRDNAA